MGYVLFESSGSFDPTKYGLKAGDTINIVAVGGGGGGGYYEGSSSSYSGATGGTTKFGSVVSALGGSGGSYSSSHTQATQGQYLGGSCRGLFVGLMYQTFAGGAGGYIPGTDNWGGNGIPAIEINSGIFNIVAPGGSMALSTMRIGSIRPSSIMISSNCPGLYKHATYGWWVPVSNGQGRGYGAGGGSGFDAVSSSTGTMYGGNSGIVKRVNYTLTSTSAITVTIGAGGAAASGGTATIQSHCSSGRAGCVEVFW